MDSVSNYSQEGATSRSWSLQSGDSSVSEREGEYDDNAEYGVEDSEEEEYLQPNSIGAFISGLLILACPIIISYCRENVLSDTSVAIYKAWTLSIFATTCLISWIIGLMLFIVSLIFFPSTYKKIPPIKDFGYLFLAQVFIISYIVMDWELYRSREGPYWNYYLVFNCTKLVLLLIPSFFWKREKSDFPMAVFAALATTAEVLLLLDPEYSWSWDDWNSQYWHFFFGYSIQVLLFIGACLTLRRAVITPNLSVSPLIFGYISFGAILSIISAVGFEIMPDWTSFVVTFKNMDKANLGQLFIIIVFFAVYFINLFLICRWSDLLSTAFTVQLSWLLPTTAYWIQYIAEQTTGGDGDSPSDWVIENPILTSGMFVSGLTLVFWMVRIGTLKCCYRYKFGRPGLIPEEVEGSFDAKYGHLL